MVDHQQYKKLDFVATHVVCGSAFSADTSYLMICAKTAGCHFAQ